MKYITILFVAAVLTLFVAIPTLASDFKVIANASVRSDTISAGELKEVFLEEKNSLHDGTHVEPVLEKDGPVHRAFLQSCLGMSESDLQEHYRTLVFTDIGSMPKTFASDAEVVAYVARTRGAIGYVSAITSVEGVGVKILALGVPPVRAERKLMTRIEPDYPDALKRLNIGGTVRLRVSISAKGAVEQIELLGGNPILGEAAAAAVKKWIYAAAPSQTVVEVSLTFDGR